MEAWQITMASGFLLLATWAQIKLKRLWRQRRDRKREDFHFILPFPG